MITRVIFVHAGRETGVDLARHQNHLAGYFFFRLRIPREIALLMAGRAVDAQGSAEHAHGGAHFFRLQNLQILRCLLNPRGLSRRRHRGSILRQDWQRAGRYTKQYKRSHRAMLHQMAGKLEVKPLNMTFRTNAICRKVR